MSDATWIDPGKVAAQVDSITAATGSEGSVARPGFVGDVADGGGDGVAALVELDGAIDALRLAFRTEVGAITAAVQEVALAAQHADGTGS